MYSLNVPVPGQVARHAADLQPALTGFESIRDDLTLVVKRLGSPGAHEYPRINQRAREALAGLAPFEVRVSDVGTFENPPRGSAPVLYFAVESPGIHEAHRRLVEEFSAVDGLEGDDYTPHITIARGGAHDAAERLQSREIDPVRWTVAELVFWDHTHGGRASSIRLPA